EIALARAVRNPATFGVCDVERLPGLLESPRAVVGLTRQVRDLFCAEFGMCNGVGHAEPRIGNIPPMLRREAGSCPQSPRYRRIESGSWRLSAPPRVAGHDSLHEFVEERNGECCFSVGLAPDHAFGNETGTSWSERSDGAVK